MNSTGTQMWFLARGRHGTHSSSRSSSSSCCGIKEAVEALWGCGSRAGGSSACLLMMMMGCNGALKSRKP